MNTVSTTTPRFVQLGYMVIRPDTVLSFCVDRVAAGEATVTVSYINGERALVQFVPPTNLATCAQVAAFIAKLFNDEA